MKVQRLHPDARLPTRGSEAAAGLDLYAIEDKWVPAGGKLPFKTGLAFAIDYNFEGQIRSRSGLNNKNITTEGTIDADYRGEVLVFLRNHGPVAYRVQPGDRIAQLVIAPVWMGDLVEVDALTGTKRGTSGFGSTGV